MPAERYSVKLEATRLAGYRTITLGVTREPLLIANADAYVAQIESFVAERVLQTFGPETPAA